MFGYYLELAFRNLKRNPGLTALMIGAVALGIAVCVMTLTLVPRDVGQPDLVEERRALRRHDGLLGPAGADDDDKPDCRRRSSPTATRWRCTPPTSRSAR